MLISDTMSHSENLYSTSFEFIDDNNDVVNNLLPLEYITRKDKEINELLSRKHKDDGGEIIDSALENIYANIYRVFVSTRIESK